MKLINLTVILLAALEIAPPAHAVNWDAMNNPKNMDFNGVYQYGFDKLPLQGKILVDPWSETYWPSNQGSINYRWNSFKPTGFNYVPPTQAQVMKMTQNELSSLSPSEKYDIFQGHYDYPLWSQVKKWSDASAPEWYGICEGWSVAAIQYSEPKPKVVKNPQEILVPFGSSDIKGLMSFAAASNDKIMNSKSKEVISYQVGIKCEQTNGTGCFNDINAGSMHVVLTNQIGLLKKSFVADRDPGIEVWNQPVYAYQSQTRGSATSTTADHGILMHTVLYYTNELNYSRWQPVVGTSSFRWGTIVMNYILDLDANNLIVGGTWVDTNYPDYFWLPVNSLTFTGSWAGMNELIQK